LFINFIQKHDHHNLIETTQEMLQITYKNPE